MRYDHDSNVRRLSLGTITATRPGASSPKCGDRHTGDPAIAAANAAERERRVQAHARRVAAEGGLVREE